MEDEEARKPWTVRLSIREMLSLPPQCYPAGSWTVLIESGVSSSMSSTARAQREAGPMMRQRSFPRRGSGTSHRPVVGERSLTAREHSRAWFFLPRKMRRIGEAGVWG